MMTGEKVSVQSGLCLLFVMSQVKYAYPRFENVEADRQPLREDSDEQLSHNDTYGDMAASVLHKMSTSRRHSGIYGFAHPSGCGGERVRDLMNLMVPLLIDPAVKNGGQR
ncbi:hypothetical protein KIN20_005375, partial [Parelaphostrongylus tenuis]